MAFLTLEDHLGTVEVVIFADIYQSSNHLLDGEDPVLVVGTVQQEEKGSKVIAQRLLGLLDAKEHLTQAIHVKLPIERLSKESLEDLKAILERHRGDCRAYVHLCTEQQCEAVIRMGDRLRVKPDRSMIDEVNRYFGAEVVSAILINGPSPVQSSRFNNRNNRQSRRSGSVL